MLGIIPSAYAAGTAQSPNLLGEFLPLILIIVVFYIFLIMPQQKQRKKHKEFISSLKKGDKVITSSGIYGTVIKVNERDVILEIAENVHIKIVKENIMAPAS